MLAMGQQTNGKLVRMLLFAITEEPNTEFVRISMVLILASS